MAVTIDLSDPDTFVAGAPHEELTELRRTQPVYFQEMKGDTGFWALLRHADVGSRARNPNLFSASEGGVVIETLSPEQAGRCGGCSWPWTRPGTSTTGAPWPSTSGAG